MTHSHAFLVCLVSLTSATWYVPCTDYNLDVNSALTTAQASEHFGKVEIVERNCKPKNSFTDDDGAIAICGTYNDAIDVATHAYNSARIMLWCDIYRTQENHFQIIILV